MASHPSLPFSGLPEKTLQGPRESPAWDHQECGSANGKDTALEEGGAQALRAGRSPVFLPCPLLPNRPLPLEQHSPCWQPLHISGPGSQLKDFSGRKGEGGKGPAQSQCFLWWVRESSVGLPGSYRVPASATHVGMGGLESRPGQDKKLKVGEWLEGGVSLELLG